MLSKVVWHYKLKTWIERVDMQQKNSTDCTGEYDREILKSLLEEYSPDQRLEVERRLKRRLRQKKLGPLNTDRLATLQALKDDVMHEFSGLESSEFHTGVKGPTAHPNDWDLDGLCLFLERRHPHVTSDVVHWFVSWSLYRHYLR